MERMRHCTRKQLGYASPCAMCPHAMGAARVPNTERRERRVGSIHMCIVIKKNLHAQSAALAHITSRKAGLANRELARVNTLTYMLFSYI